MRFVDVNVLVYAHRRESPNHEAYATWLHAARADSEPLGLADTVLSGFVRVVTHHRIFKDPTPVADALEWIDQLRASPSAMRAIPADTVWDHFDRLARSIDATGKSIPDVYIAAAAIDLNAMLVTADRGFARFKDLRWTHPLDM